MVYVTEQSEELGAYQALAFLEDTVLPGILSTDGDRLLKKVTGKVADSLLTLATYEENKQIKIKRERGGNVFTPDRKIPPVSSEIVPKGDGKLYLGRRAIAMIKDCVNNLKNSRSVVKSNSYKGS